MTQWHLNNKAWWDKLSISFNPVGSHYDCCPRQTETSLGAATEFCCFWTMHSHILHLSWGFQNSNFHLLVRLMLLFLYSEVQKKPDFYNSWFKSVPKLWLKIMDLSVCRSLLRDSKHIYSTSVKKNQMVLTLCTMKQKA